MLPHDQSSLLGLMAVHRAPVFGRGQTQSEMVNSAFVTAFLLTGNAAASEASVEKAIEEWNPPSGAAGLIREAARAALSRNVEYLNDLPLPVFLSRVMQLPECMRRCFILRCLVGMTASGTAALLSLSASHVDRCTSWAMKSVAADASE